MPVRPKADMVLFKYASYQMLRKYSGVSFLNLDKITRVLGTSTYIAGNIISDDKQKAEALGNQFKSVFTHEGNSKLPNLNDSPHGKIPKLTISLKGVYYHATIKN